MNIGKVAELSGLPPKTIRYYEDIGLIEPERMPNGYRIYSQNDLHTLRFLQRARSLGFSIEQCRELLSLYEDRDRASADVKSIARAHLKEIEAKLVELSSMRTVLEHLVEECRGDDRPDCPIIDDLSPIVDRTKATATKRLKH